LTETCERAGWAVERAGQNDVNHSDVIERIKKNRPRFVIYSGFGGQIVKSGLLDLDIPFLHMHSGWLPEFGGSTTLYYSWLRENSAAVTAFILDPKIDEGPVIARRRYPAPPKGIDVDHLYDGAIRADTLLHVLKDFIADGAFPTVSRDGEPEIYYVIHPVLKHLALISREGAA
jgi:methionyl-tRNA formyltransferase